MEENKTKPELSVVIPTYNEGLPLEWSINELIQALHEIGYSNEIVIVDGNSTDRTVEIARELGAEIIYEEDRVGKGTALRRALDFAKGDIIVMFDAQGTQDPREIGKLVKAMHDKDLDIVVGNRFGSKADIRPYSISIVSRLGNFLLNFAVRLLMGRPTSDLQSGFKVCRRQALLGLELDSQGFEIDAEISLKALRRNLAYLEVPVTTRTRIGKKLTFRDGFRIFRKIISLAL